MPLLKIALNYFRFKREKHANVCESGKPDDLSYCPNLPLILSYIDGDDVTSCQRVNRRINSVVTKYIDEMPRIPAKLMIWNHLSERKSCHVGIEIWRRKTKRQRRIWFAPFLHENEPIPKSTKIQYFCRPVDPNWSSYDTSLSYPKDQADVFVTILRRLHVNHLQIMYEFTNTDQQKVLECFRNNLRGPILKLEFLMENRSITQSCLDFAESLGGKCDVIIDHIDDTVEALNLLRLDAVTLRIQQRNFILWHKGCVIDLVLNWVRGGPAIKSLRITSYEEDPDEIWKPIFDEISEFYRDHFGAVSLKEADENMKRSFRLGRLMGDDEEAMTPEYLEVSFSKLASAVSIFTCNPMVSA